MNVADASSVLLQQFTYCCDVVVAEDTVEMLWVVFIYGQCHHV